MTVYLNGEYLPPDQAAVAPNDRSFRFGDGVFETLRFVDGRPRHLEAHLRRLQRGLDWLGVPVGTGMFADVLAELIRRNGLETGMARIVVSRGCNPPDAVGYRAPAGLQPNVSVQVWAAALPVFQCITLCISEIPVVHRWPCKVTSALPYVLAMREAAANGCDNAVLCTPDGVVAETASGNLFWIRGDALCTPAAHLPMVPGTVRELVLRSWPGDVREGEYRLPDLQQAGAVFMTNIGGFVAGVSEIRGLDWQPQADPRIRQMFDAVWNTFAGQCKGDGNRP